MPVISVDGSIGAGKTTVLKRLGNDLGIDVFLEPVEEWSQCLERFYRDPDRWGLCLNTKVLCSFAHTYKKIGSGIALCERSPISCTKVFAEVGMKDDLEFKVIKDLHDAIGWTPDIVIYIRTSPPSCMQRIAKRGRNEESNISPDYLDLIHQKYEQLYENSDVTVVVIDGERDVESVYNDVRSAVEAYATQLLVSK